MRLFGNGRQQPQEIWDEEIGWPLGDLEAANKIRAICQAAPQKPPGRKAAGSPEEMARRYERATRTAMEIAMKISDDLVRDAAVRQIIGLCMIADNRKTAAILLRAIYSETFREQVLGEYPALRS